MSAAEGKPARTRRRRKARTTYVRVPPPPPFRDARITSRTQRAFLASYALSGNISHAAAAVGMDRRTHHAWVEEDEVYAEVFLNAKQHGADYLEAVARKRAVVGSDTLLIFLLKGLRPEVYRERFEHSGPGGSPLVPGNLRVSYDYNMNPPETEFEKKRREEAEALALKAKKDKK